MAMQDQETHIIMQWFITNIPLSWAHFSLSMEGLILTASSITINGTGPQSFTRGPLENKAYMKQTTHSLSL